MVLLVLFALAQVLRASVLIMLAMLTRVVYVCLYECLLGIPAQLYGWLDLVTLALPL